MKNCIQCNKVIPKERLKALPETETCVKCSEAEPIVGITVWDKTTPELIIAKATDAKRYKELEKMDGRLERLR